MVGPKELDAGHFGRSDELAIQARKRETFLNRDVQVSGIVNGEAVLLSEREHVII